MSVHDVSAVAERRRSPAGPPVAMDFKADQATFEALPTWFAKYGDIYSIPSKDGSYRSYVISHPKYVRHVLVDNAKNYVKGRGFERVRLLLGNGIFVSDGDVWRSQRKQIQPSFRRNSLQRIGLLVRGCHIRLLERWRDCARRSIAIDVAQETSLLALSVITRATFGEEFENSHRENPFSLLADTGERDLRFLSRFRALVPVVRRAIAAHDAEHGADFLSALIRSQMERNRIVDEVLTLMVSGHETTAASLAWVWYLVSENPGVAAALRREVDSSQWLDVPPLDELSDLTYVKRTFLEALRLYPPGWIFSRRALADDDLFGETIPAGSEVILAPYVVHRRPDFWQDPETFDPSRFADAGGGGPAGAYFPFSSGPRRCIGEVLAGMTAGTHIASVMRNFVLTRADSCPVRPSAGVNLRPGEPVLIALHDRHPERGRVT